MDMPGYLDYGKMYEMNPMAFMDAQGQLDLARQFQQGRLADQEAITKGRQLSNMFEEQSMPTKLQRGVLENEGLQLNNRQTGVKTRIAEKTEGLQLSAAEKELVNKATKADLDGIEFVGQRLAYSDDPQQRAQGEALLRRHKDYLKFFDEQKARREQEDQTQKNRIALEKLRQEGQDKRIQAQATLRANATRATDKMSTDQRIGWYVQKAEEAYQAKDVEAYNYYQSQIQYLNSLLADRRPDPNAGKVDINATAGVPTIPPRPNPQPPQPGGPGPVSRALGYNDPAKATFAEVKKLYPNVSDEELRERYKKRYGVDLK
jgi:hypothetical protein